MATRIGVGDILSSYVQSAGWKAINQLVNSNSRFGIFDAKGNAFYEDGLSSHSKSLFGKNFLFNSGDNTSDVGVTAFNYNKNYNVTTAPIERGQSIAYNLVEQPRQGQVTYVSTGTQKQRKLFEDALEAAQKAINLYYLHTSERVIPNIKITGYSISRTSNAGTQLIQYQITFQEILDVSNSDAVKYATTYNNDSQSQGIIQSSNASSNQKQSAKKL